MICILMPWFLSDIMFLNKQRMVAMEELDKMNWENKFLLDRIEQLEMKKQPSCAKGGWTLNSLFLVWLNPMNYDWLYPGWCAWYLSCTKCLVYLLSYSGCQQYVIIIQTGNKIYLILVSAGSLMGLDHYWQIPLYLCLVASIYSQSIVVNWSWEGDICR